MDCQISEHFLNISFRAHEHEIISPSMYGLEYIEALIGKQS